MRKILLISLIFLSNLVFAQANYIPPQAFQYKELIRTELNTYFPNLYEYNYVPSLAEHESCISLKHKKCWNSMSRLKTSREEGAGIFQATKTYREDGSIRFDKISELRNQYKQELKDAKWETIYQRPDVQIRMAILMLRDDYNRLYDVKDIEGRLQMVDAAYNGGIGGLLKERRACSLAQGCNPNLWFGNVEKYCLKSKKILYDVRNACDINRHHVHDVFHNKIPKYQKQYFTEGTVNVKSR